MLDADKKSNVKTDGAADKPSGPLNRSWAWLWALAVLPVLVHGLLLAIKISILGELRLEKSDMWVAGIVTVYLVVCLYFSPDRRRFSRLLLITYTLLVCLALSELVLRAAFPSPPLRAPWPPNLKRVSNASNAMPGITGEIIFTTNSLGLRGPEINLDQVDVRILAIGGSSTECLYVTDRMSWPWALQDMLSERTGKKVFVGNAGHSGHFSVNHDYLLRHYEPAPRFEWVIIKLGINDMLAFISGNYEYRASMAPTKTLTNSGYIDAAYYKNLLLFRIIDLGVRKVISPVKEIVQDPQGLVYDEVRALRKKALKINRLTSPPPGLDGALANYKDDLKKIIAICQSRNQRLIFITQPTLYQENMPPELEALLLTVSPDGQSAYDAAVLASIIDSYNQTLLQLCQEHHLECIDLASRLPKDTTVFYDDCHFNISGCHQAATIIADYLAPRLAP